MLVLTRKSGQSIRISNNIIITILDSSSGQVKIGVTAPNSIPIHREEIYERIREENRSAVVNENFRPQLLNNLINSIK